MRIIASGTFDHLHDGHRLFLSTAFEQGYVMIGLTSQRLVRGKELGHLIQDYKARKSELEKWLACMGYHDGEDFEIIEIDTPHGFACDIEDIDAILVTEENGEVARSINIERAARGFRPLKVVKCELLRDEGGKLSSTRIRARSSLV